MAFSNRRALWIRGSFAQLRDSLGADIRLDSNAAMTWFQRAPRPAAPPRSDNDILRAYENNGEVTRDECRILYRLVDDPWDLGSDSHYRSCAQIIALADKYVDWQQIDWILDYGSGIGTFTRALKDAHPHIKSFGVDFDTAREAAEKRFGTGLFDHFFEMTPRITEYDLLDHSLTDLSIECMCLCFINSSYYVFKEQRRRKRIDHLARLMRKFEKLAHKNESRYLLVSSNHTDRAAVDAIDRVGPELVYLSRELELASRVAQFNSQLHTRIWRHPDARR